MGDKSLRILLVLIEPPLPFGNAASRWFHVLYRELKKRGHYVKTLVASGNEKDIAKARTEFSQDSEMEIYPFAKARGWGGKIGNLLSPHKVKLTGDFDLALRRAQPEDFDIVHVEQTWGGWASWDWPERTLINVHHLQSIDLSEIRPKAWKERLLFQRWFATERKILSHYPFVRTCSPRLEPNIKNWGEKKILQTIPVGMDHSLYPYVEKEKRQSREPILTLIGNMGWYPSVSAARRLLKEIWPRVKESVPQAKCRIVGWSAKSALKEFANLADVEILENVPEIRPYFEEASLLLYAPSRGSGMKIKVLEAMLFGVPVVTTSEGAEGLPAQDMVHCGLIDDNEGLIERAIKVLSSMELQEDMRVKARQLVESHCGPKPTVDQVEGLYAKMLS